MKAKTLKAVAIYPHEPAKEIEIENTLEGLQAFVEGWIEITYPFDDFVCVVGNEVAKLIGMEGTAIINGNIYAGPLLIVGDDCGGDFCDLTPKQIAYYTNRFKTPADISQDEVQGDIGFEIWAM